MPNWCSNDLTLSHSDASKVEGLIRYLEDCEKKDDADVQMFQYLRPRPTNQEDNWYDWNVSNWGTKWDANVYSSFAGDGHVYVSFDTAWGPPIALYDYLTAEGWVVEALYAEPGVGFCGSYSDGAEDSYEYDIENPDTYENIPDEIYQYAGIDIMLEELKLNKEESE